jgi:hypothetical protein
LHFLHSIPTQLKRRRVMRFWYLIIAGMLLAASCSSGNNGTTPGTGNEKDIALAEPTLDGGEFYDPDSLDLVISSDGEDTFATVKVDLQAGQAWTQFDLVYDEEEVNPVSVEVEPDGMLFLAPLTRPGAVPVTLASVTGSPATAVVRVRFDSGPAPRTVLTQGELLPPKNMSVMKVNGRARINWEADNPGDYNCSGMVTGKDLFPVATFFGQAVNDENQCADGNGDGVINGMDVFLISANFGTNIEGFYIYRKGLDDRTPTVVNEEPVSFQAPIGGCSADYSLWDGEAPSGAFLYSGTSANGTDEGEVTWESEPGEEIFFSPQPLGPVITLVTVDDDRIQDGDFAGGFDRFIPIECHVEGYDPDGGNVTFSWSVTGDASLWPDEGEDILLSNQSTYEVERVTIEASDNNGGSPAYFHFDFMTGEYALITSLEVNGVEVPDEGFAGYTFTHTPMEAVVTGHDRQGGEVLYFWSADNGAVVEPSTGDTIEVSNYQPGIRSKVTVSARLHPEGPEVTRSFYFESELDEDWDTDIMELKVVPHPTDPDDRIRLMLEVSDMSRDMRGILANFYYDHEKLSAEDTHDLYDDDDDCHVHPLCPWGEDAIHLFFPELQPAEMSLAGERETSVGGPVFYIDFHVISGSGTRTDFLFDAKTSRFGDPDGYHLYPPGALIPALNVQLP